MHAVHAVHTLRKRKAPWQTGHRDARRPGRREGGDAPRAVDMPMLLRNRVRFPLRLCAVSYVVSRKHRTLLRLANDARTAHGTF